MAQHREAGDIGARDSLELDSTNPAPDYDTLWQRCAPPTPTSQHSRNSYPQTQTWEQEAAAHESRPNSEDVQSDEEKGEKGVEKMEEKPAVSEGRSKGKIALIMLALCMAVFLAALDVTIITTALPTISEDFHSTAGYTWIGSAFLLANSASIPSWGKISDIFGRKPMLLLANIIFMVGSLIAALSVNVGMLIVARVIQGIGGGGLIILVNITIGDLFSLRSRGAFYGVIGGVWAIASSIGPIIGGAFTEEVTWRWCFYINLPLDGIAFFILLFFLDLKTPRTPFIEGIKAIDWIGSLTIVGGTLMFLFGLQYGGAVFPWDSATVICLLVFGVVTWGIFGFWEWKFAKYPIMPMGLFASRTRLATLGVVFFHGFVFISGSYYLPLYFQAVRGDEPLMSGVHLLPTAISLAVASIGTGVWVKKTGLFLPPIYFGMFMMTVGYGLFYMFGAHCSWGKLIGFQIIAGLGTGPIFQAPIIALQAHIKPRDIGTATATLGFVRQLATSSSVVIGQVVFQNQMEKKAAKLTRILGPRLAQELGGANAGANTRIINSLPAAQKAPVRVAYADSLKPMWAMYAAFAGAGLITAFFIRRKVLTAQHEETKTGLEAEKENAAARATEKEEKRQSRQSKVTGSRTSLNRISMSTRDVSRPASPPPSLPPLTPRMRPADNGERVYGFADSKKATQPPRLETRNLEASARRPKSQPNKPPSPTAARGRPADLAKSARAAQSQPPRARSSSAPYQRQTHILSSPTEAWSQAPPSAQGFMPRPSNNWPDSRDLTQARPSSRGVITQGRYDVERGTRDFQRPSGNLARARYSQPDVRAYRKDEQDYNQDFRGLRIDRDYENRDSRDLPRRSYENKRATRDYRDSYEPDRAAQRPRRYSERIDRRSTDYPPQQQKQSQRKERESGDHSHKRRRPRPRRKSTSAVTNPSQKYSAALDYLYQAPAEPRRSTTSRS